MTARTQEQRRRPWHDAAPRFRAFIGDETGDVPGWVLVTFVTGASSRRGIRTRSHS